MLDTLAYFASYPFLWVLLGLFAGMLFWCWLEERDLRG